MSGIILLVMLVVWSYVAKKLSGFCVSKIVEGYKKSVVHFLLLLMFVIAPVVDEIIGSVQFRSICVPENILKYDVEKARGKSISLYKTPNYTIDDKIVPIRVTHTQWVDSVTDEILIDHKIFYNKGGWLSRLVGVERTDNCDLKEYYTLFKKLNITILEQ